MVGLPFPSRSEEQSRSKKHIGSNKIEERIPQIPPPDDGSHLDLDVDVATLLPNLRAAAAAPSFSSEACLFFVAGDRGPRSPTTQLQDDVARACTDAVASTGHTWGRAAPTPAPETASSCLNRPAATRPWATRFGGGRRRGVDEGVAGGAANDGRAHLRPRRASSCTGDGVQLLESASGGDAAMAELDSVPS